jgi:hypothetical protein
MRDYPRAASLSRATTDFGAESRVRPDDQHAEISKPKAGFPVNSARASSDEAVDWHRMRELTH